MPWLSVLAPIAGGLIQGGMSGGGSSKAAGISQQAITTATANSQPYTTAGTNALSTYQDLLGLNGTDASTKAMAGFTASPGVAYQQQQGLRAVDAGAAANGMLRSGATLKAEQTLGSNLANQDFGNYLGRINGLITNGLSATTSLNGLISGQSTNQEQIAGQGATQQASIYGNALTGTLGAAKTNGLFDNASSAIWNGMHDVPGTTGGAGTNALQSMGLFNPLPKY